MVRIPSAGMPKIDITSCTQLSFPGSCISFIKVHIIERLLIERLPQKHGKVQDFSRFSMLLP